MSMFGPQDGQLCASNIGGGKKGNPLNVIPVRMTQEQVRVYRAWLRQQRLTQSTDARASVKDDERVIIEPYFDTGSIATVAHGAGSWCGYGSACPPEPDLHVRPPRTFPARAAAQEATGSPWLLATSCESTPRRALPPYQAMIELYIPLNHARPGIRLGALDASVPPHIA